MKTRVQVVHVLVLVLDDLILGDSTEIDEATGWRLSGRTLVPMISRSMISLLDTKASFTVYGRSPIAIINPA
jgi:hypothetical protein